LDKITRVLLLYSKLIRGEKVRKLEFCMEADSNSRSFDRDIEDIRLYLAELFQTEELRYDRQDGSYYLTGAERWDLELPEFQLLEGMLLELGLLRKDEVTELLEHLSSNAKIRSLESKYSDELLSYYREPLHNKPLLKMHGDLMTVLKQQSVIEMQYCRTDEGTEVIRVLPCRLNYELGRIILLAFPEKTEKETPESFQVEQIYSFQIIRTQYKKEQEKVRYFLQNEDMK